VETVAVFLAFNSPRQWGSSYSITGLDRPLGLQEVKASRISIQSAHRGCMFVSPMHRPPLGPRRYSWYPFLLKAESTPGP